MPSQQDYLDDWSADDSLESVKSMRELMAPWVRVILEKYPYKGEFDSQALARWHVTAKPGDQRFGSFNRVHYEGKPLTWIGAKGWITEAPINMKWHYIRAVEQHNNEDAAKEWAFLQGYSVSSHKSHIPELMNDLFKEGHTHGLEAIGGSSAVTPEPDFTTPEPF